MSSYELRLVDTAARLDLSKIFDAPRSLGTQHAMRLNRVEVGLTAPAVGRMGRGIGSENAPLQWRRSRTVTPI